MPNLPFFTVSPAASPLKPTSETAGNSYSPQGKQGLEGSAAVSAIDPIDGAESGHTSFYQALSEQLEEPLLSVGQELAAYSQDQTNAMITDDIAEKDLALAPWEVAEEDLMIPAALDVKDIQFQREAQVQVNDGQKTGQNNAYFKWQEAQLSKGGVEGTNASVLEERVTVGMSTNTLNGAVNPNNPVTNTLASNPLTEAAAVSPPIMNGVNNKVPNTDGALPLGDEISILDGEVDAINIHEKPMTLIDKTALQGPPAPIIPMQAQLNQAQAPQGEAFEGLMQVQATVNPKELTTASSTEQKLPIMEGVQASQQKLKLDMPANSVQWSEQISKRIAIMNAEGLQSARIQLDPPELGALEIKIKVTSDQVSVGFASNHPTVREALEAQAPRLREMMEQEGIDLADVNVSEQGQQHTGGESPSDELSEGDGFAAESDTELESGQASVIESDSLVDYFA